MNSKYRFVPASPDRIEKKKEIGPAWALEEFLVNHQDDATGRVNYGRPFGYAWILSKWDGAPNVRTLKRHMARLRALGRVWVHVVPYGGGMIVRVLNSVKWAPVAAQMGLFPAPDPVLISSGKPVSKRLKTAVVPDVQWGTVLSPIRGHFCPPNEVKNLREETNYSSELGQLVCSPVEKQDPDARRRLLEEQRLVIEKKYKTSC